MLKDGLEILKNGLEQDNKTGNNNFIILVFSILSIFMLGGFNFLNKEIKKNQSSAKEDIITIQSKIEKMDSKINILDKFKAVIEDRENRKKWKE